MRARAIAVVFWLLAAFTVVEALIPARRSLHLFAWDKLEHGFAFAVLALVALFAFPRRSKLWLGLSLSALGAAIELTQALPFIARDGDVRDWIADTIAIGLVLGTAELVQRFARLN